MNPATGYLLPIGLILIGLCPPPSMAAKTLSLNFQRLDIRAAFYALAEHSGHDMVIGDAIKGTISLKLTDVNWEQALDVLLRAQGLEQQRIGKVIHILRKEDLSSHNKYLAEARRQHALLQTRSLQLFHLNYRSAADIKKLIEEGKLLSEKGTILTDPSSNVLMVHDIPDSAQAIQQLIKDTDKPIRQILIEARIVEASDHFSRELGSKLQLAQQLATTGAGSPALATDMGQGPFAARVELPVATPFGSISALFRASASMLISLELQAMQAEGRGKVISSPRLLTADGTEASIEDGSEIPYSQTGRKGYTSTSFKKATLSLRIKPSIAPDSKSVWVEINLSKDTPNYRQTLGGAPIVDTKRIHTLVNIEHGGTVILGGIYIDAQSENNSLVPFLGDIPLIGWLFRGRHSQNSRRELMIFITPHIISPA